MAHFEGITDEKGRVRFDDMPPGIYTVTVEAEGSEPVERKIQVKSPEDDVSLNINLKPITTGFLALQNKRLRALILSSTDMLRVGAYVSESERLIKLSSPGLRKYATSQFEKTSESARRRIEELRKLESSVSVGIGPTGLKFSKRVKKR